MGRRMVGQVAYVRGRWVARVSLHRDAKREDGRARTSTVVVLRPDRTELTSQSKVTHGEARRYAARLQARYDEGTWSPAGAEPDVPTNALTVESWVSTWLGRQTYSEVGKDRARTKRWLKLTPKFASLLVGKVTPRDAAAWLGELRALPSDTGKLAAPRTIRNIANPVSRALKSAVFEGLLVADPFAVLPTEIRPKSVDADPMKRRGYRLSGTELETVLGESSVAPRWRTVWYLLGLTGLRVGEAIALHWSDLLEKKPLRCILVTKQVHHRTRTIEALKTHVSRDVPEHPLLREALEWWREVGWPQEYGRKPLASDLIIPGRDKGGRPWGAAGEAGGPLWSQDVYRALQRDLTACGIVSHRVHDLRHTLASLCADAGMEENVAARWTHAPTGQSSRHLYALPSWERQCTEMLKLVLKPKKHW